MAKNKPATVVPPANPKSNGDQPSGPNAAAPENRLTVADPAAPGAAAPANLTIERVQEAMDRVGPPPPPRDYVFECPPGKRYFFGAMEFDVNGRLLVKDQALAAQIRASLGNGNEIVEVTPPAA